MQRSYAIIFDFNGEWIRLQITKPFAQVITDYAVYHKHAIGIHRRGENFAPGQVAPFVTCNDATGLEPLEFRRKLCFEFGPMRCFAGDAIDLTRVFDQTLAELVDCAKIGAHSFDHDLAIDIHHVSVTDPVMVYHAGHLSARAEFAGLGLRGEDRYLRQCQVVENDLRHVWERPARVMFEDKQTVIRPDLLHYRLQRRRDVAGERVRDDRDSLLRF